MKGITHRTIHNVFKTTVWMASATKPLVLVTTSTTGKYNISKTDQKTNTAEENNKRRSHNKKHNKN